MEGDWGKCARRAGRLMSGAALAVTAAIAVLALAPALLGLQRYVIVSGSMTGTYDRGSLVLDQVVPVASLKVGDVITYRAKAEGAETVIRDATELTAQVPRRCATAKH